MPEKPIFGGKAKHARLPWYPLPYMQMFLDRESTKGHTASHLTQLKASLAYFGQFAQREGIRHPEELERIHILRYQAWLIQGAKKQDGGPLSDGYQRQLLHGLRLWINWLAKDHHITETPWVRIKITSSAKRSMKMEPEDVLAVFSAHRQQAFATTPFFFHRREAILAVLFTWGLMLNELRSLNISNLDMRQDFITVRSSRGARSRMLPYGPEMKDIIARYLTQRVKHALPTEDALFIDSTGERMSDRNVQKVLRDLGERAGVQLTPQRLRDTYGFRLLESGMDRQIVRDLLGHTRTVAVNVYDPKVGEARRATQKLEADLIEMLGRTQHEYRRLS